MVVYIIGSYARMKIRSTGWRSLYVLISYIIFYYSTEFLYFYSIVSGSWGPDGCCYGELTKNIIRVWTNTYLRRKYCSVTLDFGNNPIKRRHPLRLTRFADTARDAYRSLARALVGRHSYRIWQNASLAKEDHLLLLLLQLSLPLKAKPILKEILASPQATNATPHGELQVLFVGLSLISLTDPHRSSAQAVVC